MGYGQNRLVPLLKHDIVSAEPSSSYPTWENTKGCATMEGHMSQVPGNIEPRYGGQLPREILQSELQMSQKLFLSYHSKNDIGRQTH